MKNKIVSQMNTLRTMKKSGIITLMFSLFLIGAASAKSNNVTTDGCCDNTASETVELVKIEKLIAEIQQDDEFSDFEKIMKEEGILDSRTNTKVAVLDVNGKIVYEGDQQGLSFSDKKLEQYVDKADFLVNVDGTAYYMIF